MVLLIFFDLTVCLLTFCEAAVLSNIAICFAFQTAGNVL
nr:MAG TPA: hypothetical protein [Caudoviricetes sp.]